MDLDCIECLGTAGSNSNCCENLLTKVYWEFIIKVIIRGDRA
jgi:hypothetical protein